MSNATTVTMIPPPDESVPTQLQLGPTTVLPNSSGQFVVPATAIAQLQASGWQIVITGNPPTHVP